MARVTTASIPRRVSRPSKSAPFYFRALLILENITFASRLCPTTDINAGYLTWRQRRTANVH